MVKIDRGLDEREADEDGPICCLLTFLEKERDPLHLRLWLKASLSFPFRKAKANQSEYIIRKIKKKYKKTKNADLVIESLRSF